jgi:hypothetical protein
MRIAVDIAVWRVRSFGTGLAGAGVVLLLVAAVMRRFGFVVVAVAAIIVAAMLARSHRVFIRRQAARVLQTVSQTLALLSLPHTTDRDRFRVEVPGCLAIRVHTVPSGSLVAFVPAGLSASREQFLVRTLLKYQRTIHTIP